MKITNHAIIAMFVATPLLTALPHTAYADQISFHEAVDAAILSQIAKERQAQQQAGRQAYAGAGAGANGPKSITTATAAAKACGLDALSQAGPQARLDVVPRARSMATGWEVEGELNVAGGSRGFVCSVRNGAVTGVLLR